VRDFVCFTHLAVGHFLLPVLPSEIRSQASSEIKAVQKALANSRWRHIFLRSISMDSTLDRLMTMRYTNLRFIIIIINWLLQQLHCRRLHMCCFRFVAASSMQSGLLRIPVDMKCRKISSDVQTGVGHADQSADTLSEWAHEHSRWGPMSGCWAAGLCLSDIKALCSINCATF